MITTHLPTPEGWDNELAWSLDPQQTLYPLSVLSALEALCDNALPYMDTDINIYLQN